MIDIEALENSLYDLEIKVEDINYSLERLTNTVLILQKKIETLNDKVNGI